MQATITDRLPAATGTAVTTDQDPRWRSVLRRDVHADGRFVFAVRTTGVYCRPSCPARHARPQNVRFFDTGADARAAGFRACQRCHPDGPSVAQRNAAAIAEACRLLASPTQAADAASLADAVGMSPSHFHRQFKAVTGSTPKAYAAAQRARSLRDGLSDATSTVTRAIYDAGFNASSRFYENGDSMLGMTPTAFRRGGADTDIRFAVGQCSLGAILVACSDKGICAISLGDDPLRLVSELQDRFPNANLIGADPDFEALVARVVGLVEEPGRGVDLPMDLRGTAFQQRVWQALRRIPAGRTASYADIAQRIGEPRSARAVAQACGANPLAVAIPCHRVVRGDGRLSGYRWGVERKRALLDREGDA